MHPSIATAPEAAGRGRVDRTTEAAGRLERVDPAWIGLGFVLLAAVVYFLSNTERASAGIYTHFVWQADAFLDGRFAIPYPDHEPPFVNGQLQDFWPLPDQPGWALIPFPPLPALVLLPFVALFGLAADQGLVAVGVGALNVGLAWRMVLRLTERPAAAALATTFYGFGTVAWYAAMLGTTWFLAHVIASTFLLLAITAAFDGERQEAIRGALRRRGWIPSEDATTLLGAARDRLRQSFAAVRSLIEPSQFMAGFLFGLAGMSRLTVMFGAPFFVFVGAGGSLARRAVSAGLGASIPVALVIAYNLASTGHFFHPAYEYLYRNEYRPRPDLNLFHEDWAIEDVRYIPQNALIMLAWPPEIGTPPGCDFSLLDRKCAFIKPENLGMSLFLTSPGYLLALPLLAVAWRRRVVIGAALAVLAIAIIDLMHFSQGWVQFGYRFSNDFAPFALVLVALAIAWRGVTKLTVGLVAASVLINLWGVYWGVVLNW